MAIYVKIENNVAVEVLNYNSDAHIPDGWIAAEGDVKKGDTWNGAGWTDERPFFVKRKEEYPPVENYLDGIVKGDQAQIDKYISDCLAVKERFPKE